MSLLVFCLRILCLDITTYIFAYRIPYLFTISIQMSSPLSLSNIGLWSTCPKNVFKADFKMQIMVYSAIFKHLKQFATLYSTTPDSHYYHYYGLLPTAKTFWGKSAHYPKSKDNFISVAFLKPKNLSRTCKVSTTADIK